MAKSKNTSTIGALDSAELSEMAVRLNDYGALLAGIEEICNAEDIGGNALSVAATICAQINNGVCTIADRLSALSREGGTV